MASTDSSDLEYVGFWARTGAAVIDSILVMLITLPLVHAVYGAAYWETEKLIAGPADFFISWVLPTVLVLALWIRLSATPGKLAIGAVIVDARTGGKPTSSQFLIRYLGYFVACIPLMLGIFWVAIDPRKQGWHDKMAGTVVVRRKGGAQEPVRFEQAERRP